MRVVVVTGPPCAGKSTHARTHAGPRDVVIDLDALAHALGYPHPHIDWNGDAHLAVDLALRVRESALKVLRDPRTYAHDGTAYVLATNGARLPRAEHVHLDPGRDECHARARADDRPAATHQQIDAWYDQRKGH